MVAVGCALTIAACAATGTTRSTTRSSSDSGAVAYAGCMRSHGVPNFPDAIAGGGFELPAGLNTQSPAYTAAGQMCTKLLPAPIAQHVLSESDQRQFVAAAKCMRGHGTDIADPTFNGPYITLDVPDQTTIQSPVFKRAEQACHYPLPKQAVGAPAPP
jgi:hypothetical protein